jgi:hypothetical protein
MADGRSQMPVEASLFALRDLTYALRHPTYAILPSDIRDLPSAIFTGHAFKNKSASRSSQEALGIESAIRFEPYFSSGA